VDALVFSGGGARGAYQIGVYEALTEHGFHPDLVTGTSVGAILATLVAARTPPTEMKRLWLKACQPGFMPYRRDVHRFHRWDHVRDNDGLEELLREEVDWDAVRRSSVDLHVTAVDVCDGERVAFDNDGISPEAVLASTAIPLLFPPERVNGHVLWDGGLLASTPLQPAIENGATRIVAILNEPWNVPADEAPANLREAFDRVIDIVNQRSLRKDLRRAREINELVARDQAAPYWRHIDIDLIAPDESFGVDVLDFEEVQAERLWARGREDARAFLAEGGHGFEPTDAGEVAGGG
jgi:NTE family protein